MTAAGCRTRCPSGSQGTGHGQCTRSARPITPGCPSVPRFHPEVSQPAAAPAAGPASPASARGQSPGSARRHREHGRSRPGTPRTDVPKCKCTNTPRSDVPRCHLAMQSHPLPPQILSPCRSSSAPVLSKLPAGHTLPSNLLEAIVAQPRAAPTARAGACGAPPGDAAAGVWQPQPRAGAGQWGRSQTVLTKPIPVQRGRAPGSCSWGCARAGGTGARVPTPGGVSTRRGAAAKARTD